MQINFESNFPVKPKLRVRYLKTHSSRISTSDGRGTNALQVFTWKDSAGASHDDLYVAESGGAGLSVIKDVDGTAGRPACTTAGQCAATTVTLPNGAPMLTFPSGLASDGKQLYVGDAPLNGPSRVLTWNPVTGAQGVLSTDITPSYTPAFDGVKRTQYSHITGLGLNPANLDVYIADDPSAKLATPIAAQGHLWKVSGSALTPTVTSISPATGDVAAGTVVTITGTNLVNSVAGAADPTAFGTTVAFGTAAGTAVSCTADGTQCTATTPQFTGAGILHVRVTNIEGQTSAATATDQFTVTTAPAPPGAPTVSSISPTTGVTAGGTAVTITGTLLRNADGSAPAVSFGTTQAATVSCASDTSCAVTSPPGTDGQTVDVQVTTGTGTSPAVPADRFSYVTPIGKLTSYGITAPKGGVTWVPDTTSSSGHYWVSDHGNGLCRLDPVPGTTLLAPNVAACDPGFTIGSPGQAVYDPRANADGTHWIYVPDNAVRSPGVWRLTFHPATATIDTPTAMAPGLLDNLKTNSLALDASKDSLYVGDLVDGNIRRVNGINGDPRSQTVDIVGITQAAKVGAASRGINGTMTLLGNRLFLPENNAATYIDVTAPCANPAANPGIAPCASITLNFLTTPSAVFIAGVAADAQHNLLYISESPGTANATIYRFDVATITAANPNGTAGSVYVTAGAVPAAGSPDATVYCSLTCTRPGDPALTPGGTTGFPFAQGLYVDPSSSALFVTEDVTAGARGGRGHVWTVPFVQ